MWCFYLFIFWIPSIYIQVSFVWVIVLSKSTAIKSFTTQVAASLETALIAWFDCHIMERTCSLFVVNTNSIGVLQTMFPTVPIYYFPPPSVHTFIHSVVERRIEEGMPENKHLECGVMKAIAPELLLPTQERQLVNSVSLWNSKVPWAPSGTPRSRISWWWTIVQTA